MADPVEALDRALKQPADYLGTIERNTEIKVVYLTLWALGWDPMRDVALGFHIRAAAINSRNEGSAQKSACAVDFGLRQAPGKGPCLLGEAKRWDARDDRWNLGITQVVGYKRALGLQRAFLTDGRRWLILNDTNETLIQHQPGSSAERLLGRLREHLGKTECQALFAAPATDWNYGISPENHRDCDVSECPGCS